MNRHSSPPSRAGILPVLILCTFLATCGGGSSTSIEPPPPPPDFFLTVTPISVSISPGSSANVQVLVQGLHGFSGSVSVNVSGLPTGVTTTPSSPFTLTLNVQQTVTIAVPLTVTSGNYTLTFQGTSGTLSHSATLLLAVEPLASFSLSLNPSSLTLRTGSTISTTVIADTGVGSTNYSLQFSVAGLPTGVTANFSPNPAPPLTSVSLTLTAAPNAPENAGATVTVSATRLLDSVQQSAPLTLAIAQPIGALPGNRTNFTRTDDTPSSMVYDSAHGNVFVALPDLARVDVIAPSTGQITKVIPVPDAQGLSLSPDGSRVLVGGYTQRAIWIDTSSLEIVQRNVLPTYQPSCPCPPEFIASPSPMIMANGKVLLSSALEWDPKAGTITTIAGGSNQGSIAARSADGTKAIFSTNTTPGTISLYDSATNTFTASLQFEDFPFAVAANPTGSQFVVVVNNEGIFFLDNQFNILGQAPVGGAVTGLVYSLDGTSLYIVSTPNNVPVISTINSSTFQLVGQSPAYATNIAYITRDPPLFVESPMAADSSGMLFGSADHGVAMDDSTDFQNFGVSATPPIFAIIVSPAEGSQNTPTPITIATQSFSTVPDIWFGLQRGTNLSLSALGQAQATSPASSTPGPVNVKIISPDGTEGNIPEAFTFGSVPVTYGVLAVPPSGGVAVNLFGYGFSTDVSGSSIQVSIGTENAPNFQQFLFPAEYPFGYPFPLEQLYVTVPAGSAGASDIVITSPSGAATFSKGLHYVQSVADYASADKFQFALYDSKRQQIYLANSDHVDVFSITSHSFLSPIVPPSLGTSRGIVWVALTPDNSTLLVANTTDDSVAVINPDNPSTAKAVQIVPTGTGNGSTGPSAIATTSTGIAYVTTQNNNVESATSLNFYQIDLSTLQVSTVPISGNNDFSGGGLVKGAKNGSVVLAYFEGSSGGPVYSWSAAANTWSIEHDTGVFIRDAAASADGNVFALVGTPSLNFLDPLTNVIGRTGLPEFMTDGAAMNGLTLHDSGSIAYVPVVVSVATEGASSSENGIDIYDVNRGELRERLILKEGFPSTTTQGMVVDPTGQNIFLITNAGLTTITLDSVPLSIGSVNPSSGAAGTALTIRGSGFVSGTMAAFNNTTTSVSFVDADTLQTTIPASLTPGAVSVTLTNPDGSTYTLDDGFTIE
jgi:hypothetical protein